jgi:hypothetical protein
VPQLELWCEQIDWRRVARQQPKPEDFPEHGPQPMTRGPPYKVEDTLRIARMPLWSKARIRSGMGRLRASPNLIVTILRRASSRQSPKRTVVASSSDAMMPCAAAPLHGTVRLAPCFVPHSLRHGGKQTWHRSRPATQVCHAACVPLVLCGPQTVAACPVTPHRQYLDRVIVDGTVQYVRSR